MSRGWIAGCMLAMVVAGSPASAASFEDLRGTWCGLRSNPNVTNYTFTRSSLTVLFFPDRRRKVFEIDDFEFTGDWVRVIYFADGRKVHVDFDLDGDRMYQRANSAGPAYTFRRC